MSATAQLLLTLALVIGAAQLGGRLAGRLQQPPVIGEVLAGIVLGPSLLGLVHPGLPELLAPDATRTVLGGFADVGVVLFMFLVGLELKLSASRLRMIGPTAAGSMFLPMALGCGLGYFIYPHFSEVAGSTVPRVAFILFCGAAMSVTACPVLARVLRSYGLNGSRVGDVAMGSAAMNDILAWVLLGVIIGLTGTAQVPWWLMVPGTALLASLMIFCVRPALAALDRRVTLHTTQWVIGASAAVALLSAATSDAIGIHSIFGPFLLGLAVPRRPALIARLEGTLGEVTVVVLLPAFFLLAGMRVDVGLIGISHVVLLVLVVALAVTGKILGAAVPARLSGLDPRSSLTVGLLMNTRGLTELVMLGIGLQLGLLSDELYTIFVLMALSTTAMTGPLLSIVNRTIRIVPAELTAVADIRICSLPPMEEDRHTRMVG